MTRAEWACRGCAAAAGIAGYPRLYPTDWSNPYLLLYDVPTLALGFSFLGAALYRLAAGPRREGGVRLGSLLAATFLAWGSAEPRLWPLSGHLTVATTAGIQESVNQTNPAWLRRLAPLPAVLLILIRTFRPQSEQMANRPNTLAAVLAGAALGTLALWLAARRKK